MRPGLLLFLVACGGEGEGDDLPPLETVTLSAPYNTCTGDILKAGTLVDPIPDHMEVEIRADDVDVVERHPMMPGESEDGEPAFAVELEVGAAEMVPSAETVFTCEDVPYSALFAYDEHDRLVACYVGTFVEDQFDMSGCP